MRILMFTAYFPPQYSGAAKQAIALAKLLRDRGHLVEFATVRWPGLAASDQFEGFAVHRLEQGGGTRHREFRLWWSLFRFCSGRARDFEIIHSHGAYYTNSFVGPLARWLGWKSLAKASLADNDLHGVGKSWCGMLHARFLKKIDVCLAISRDLEREFLQAGIARDKVHYLPNGVDTARFHPLDPQAKAGLRRRLGLPAGRRLVLTIGVFDQRKNIGWLMEQWAGNRAFGTGAQLVAIGPRSREDAGGVFFAGLQRLSAAHPELLRMQDHVDDIELYYQAADLFILPSHSEGMPNVILEAMASGLCCVATRVSGVTDLVQEGRTGHTFIPGDAASLQAALELAVADTGGSLGRAARALAETSFSLVALAQRYEDLYGNLTAGRNNPPRPEICESPDHA